MVKNILSIEDDNFEEILNKTVNRFLNDISLKDERIQIKALKAKKTVMSLFRFKANATLGVFEIKGDLKAISALSLSGLLKSLSITKKSIIAAK